MLYGTAVAPALPESEKSASRTVMRSGRTEVEQPLLEIERVQERARRVRHEERFGGIEVNQAQVGRLDDPQLRPRRQPPPAVQKAAAHNDDRGPNAQWEQRRQMLSQVAERRV